MRQRQYGERYCPDHQDAEIVQEGQLRHASGRQTSVRMIWVCRVCGREAIKWRPWRDK